MIDCMFAILLITISVFLLRKYGKVNGHPNNKWSNDGAIMKTYTREELEKLATENPQELALLFAQKVAGLKDVSIERRGIEQIPTVVFRLLSHRGRLDDSTDLEFGVCPDYLTDWTVVINAGKKAGIFYCLTDFSASASKVASLRGKNKLQQQPDWPDCAALMIVMIEVMQK